MKVVFLGTGTSAGVPMIGCDCGVCHSADPRDRRSRASIVLSFADTTLLVDTSPELRIQALANDIRHVDAILFTHAHADHTAGLDDIRRFNVVSRQAMPMFGDETTMADIRRRFSYAFSRDTPQGGGIPSMQLWTVAGAFCIGGHEIVPVPIMHGRRTILGFRAGRFAYLTDCSAIPESSMALLRGVDVLAIDALRPRPHPTHFSLDEALAAAARIGATRTYFTHIAHDMAHAETCASLPAGVTLAYDGLVVSV